MNVNFFKKKIKSSPLVTSSDNFVENDMKLRISLKDFL